MKIVTVVGARPQFVKAAMVSKAFKKFVPNLYEVMVHTGQHFDANMSQIFFDELDIPRPDYNLGVGGGTHGQNTGRMIEKLEAVLLREDPDWVLVYGDTDSTLSGVIAATKLHIPVAHVEAGLRSYNRRMPEEINRILTDHAADLLFAPTTTAVQNLRDEGIPAGRICLVGDVMLDAALYYSSKALHTSNAMSRFDVRPGKYMLATIHRAENTGDPRRLHAILSSIARVGQDFPVIFPLHPRTRKAIEALAVDADYENVLFCEPLGYLDMVMLEQHAVLNITDSGGVQKESFFFRVPCVTLRDETEWVELVSLGWNRVCPPTSADKIIDALLSMRGQKGDDECPFGKGDAAEKVAERLWSERPFDLD